MDEEFNVLNDFYFPIKEQEKLYSSKEYKLLQKNKIDTAEFEGNEPDKDAGEIKFDKDNKEANNDIFLNDIYDFVFKDLPRDTLISVIRGGTNAFQFVNNFTAAVGINPDDTNIMINQKLDKIKGDLNTLDKDSPLVSKLLGVAAQDAAYTYPIYKKFKSAGVPKSYAMPLAFGIGGALAFDKSDSFFVDSTSMRNLKDFIGVAPDTPIEEMYDKSVQALEFGAFGKFFDVVLNGVKAVKNIPAKQVKQTAIAGGGAATATAVVDTAKADESNTEFENNKSEILNLVDKNLSMKEISEKLNITEEAAGIGIDFYKYGGAGVPLPEFDDKGNMIDDGLYKGEPKGFIKKKSSKEDKIISNLTEN